MSKHEKASTHKHTPTHVPVKHSAKASAESAEPGEKTRKEGQFLRDQCTIVHPTEISELKSQLSQRNKMGVIRIASGMIHKLITPAPRNVVFGKDAWELDEHEFNLMDDDCGKCIELCTPLASEPSHPDIPSDYEWSQIVGMVHLALSLIGHYRFS